MASDDHVKAYKGYMDRIRAICKFFDQRFSVIPVAWFWRHRFRAMALFMRGTNIATFTPGAPLSTLRAKSFFSGSQLGHMPPHWFTAFRQRVADVSQ